MNICDTNSGPTPGVVSNEDPSNGFMYSNPRWVVSSNGSLIVAQAQESDAGIYACQVENGIGPGLSKNIGLKINGNPARFSSSEIVVEKSRMELS
ncbi:ig-like domain-containing protein [Caerostris darwini]|uniref:Ig-like domain-containing protein n=1 Tax=Caerostris darwini TaxID=1538125 RepID=A0AAV4SRE6_9ARAC|nr:ig-like domain-containing protein [Caerostris darwini]